MVGGEGNESSLKYACVRFVKVEGENSSDSGVELVGREDVAAWVSGLTTEIVESEG